MANVANLFLAIENLFASNERSMATLEMLLSVLAMLLSTFEMLLARSKIQIFFLAGPDFGAKTSIQKDLRFFMFRNSP